MVGLVIQLGNKHCFLKNYFKIWSLFIFIFTIQNCTPSIPKGINPVINFDLTKYTGIWYEIARFDYSFERGLEEVTATYTQSADGSIEVKNEGTPKNGSERKTKIGKAKPVGNPTIGHLKVSFFSNIYTSYVVFYIEPDYSVALVTGSSKNYCWILSRSPELSQENLNKYIQILQEKGFATDKLIFPKPYAKNNSLE